jgi:predicted TIM-barrel fold metal-dependent hydrolase
MLAPPVIVDFHSHLIPPAWGQAQRLPPALTDAEALLARKAADGIGTIVVSNAMLNLPGAPVDNRSLDRIKEWNAFAHDLVSANPGRVHALGGVDAFGGPDMLEEMRATVGGGALKGVLVHSSVNGKYLDAPEAADFWALAAELEVPVFIHSPADPAGAGAVTDFRVLEFAARASDVGLGVAALIMGGVLERHPRLRVACANGGGGLAMLAGRLETAYRLTASPDTQPPGPPSSYLERVYVDSCSYSAAALRCNLEVFGPGRVLFGTDYPPMDVPVAVTTGVLDELGISDDHRERILRRNAAELLGIDVAPG